jgi:hypothetical protein
MPIKASYRWLYPIDWRELSIAIRFGRARGRCEGCGRPHGRVVYHLGDGRWWDEDAGRWRTGRGRAVRGLVPPEQLNQPALTTRVVLSCAHLDHDPTNNKAQNLKALCQRCHLEHDRPEHQRRRWFTLFSRRALGDLFLGPY